MKLHLPIGLRKALMAVFAALAVSPAVATAADNVTINNNYVTGETYREVTGYGYDFWKGGLYVNYGQSSTCSENLVMNGEASNKIVSADGAAAIRVWTDTKLYNLPGYIGGNTNPNVKVDGSVTMSTSSGYNAIVGSVAGDVGFNIVAKSGPYFV